MNLNFYHKVHKHETSRILSAKRLRSSQIYVRYFPNEVFLTT